MFVTESEEIVIYGPMKFVTKEKLLLIIAVLKQKLAESEAEPILQELRLGKRISRDISLADLYQEWLELKILPSSRSEETKKKYLLRKNTIERLLEIKKSLKFVRVNTKEL